MEIAALLGVTRPSVHRMIEALKETGLIRRDGPLLFLTAQGREFLGHYKEDYTAFTAFFQKELGLSDMQAEDNAIALLGALCPKCRKALSNLLRNP